MIKIDDQSKNDSHQTPPFQYFSMVRPTGIEPAHLAPEASALSPELRAQLQVLFYNKSYVLARVLLLQIKIFTRPHPTKFKFVHFTHPK